MTFITSLFGGGENSGLTALIALGVALLVIILAVWLVRTMFNATSNASRNRNRRLSVVDSLAIDPKRHLLIIRRDNVEHVLLVGGPQDVVVESGIVVGEGSTAQSNRRPVPMVAARKPAPAAPVGPNAPVQAPPVAMPARPLTKGPNTVGQQLRDMGQPMDKKTHLSLRHTGLLRPVTEAEAAAAQNAATVVAPEPKSPEQARREAAAELAGANSEANRT